MEQTLKTTKKAHLIFPLDSKKMNLKLVYALLIFIFPVIGILKPAAKLSDILTNYTTNDFNSYTSNGTISNRMNKPNLTTRWCFQYKKKDSQWM